MFIFCVLLFMFFIMGFMYLFYQTKLIKDEFEEVYDTIYDFFKEDIKHDRRI